MTDSEGTVYGVQSVLDYLAKQKDERVDYTFLAARYRDMAEQIRKLENPWMPVDESGFPEYGEDVVYRDVSGELHMFEDCDDGDRFKMHEYRAVKWMAIKD